MTTFAFAAAGSTDVTAIGAAPPFALIETFASVKTSKVIPFANVDSFPFVSNTNGAAGQNNTATPAVITPVRTE